MKTKSIDKLILTLNTCAIDKIESCYLDSIKSIDIKLDELEQYFTFNDDRPTRIRLSSTKDYQLFLSCWEKDQQGPIHDIDSEEAWIHPVCGQLLEERYQISKTREGLEQVSSVLLNSDSYSFMQKSKTIYRYINDYESRSVCLHLYSRPVTQWREYDKSTGEISLVPHVYDKLVDKYKNIK